MALWEGPRKTEYLPLSTIFSYGLKQTNKQKNRWGWWFEASKEKKAIDMEMEKPMFCKKCLLGLERPEDIKWTLISQPRTRSPYFLQVSLAIALLW